MEGGGGAMSDEYQILNIFRASPIARPLFSRRSHLHLEHLGPPSLLQHLISYIFWCKIGNRTSTGVSQCVA